MWFRSHPQFQNGRQRFALQQCGQTVAHLFVSDQEQIDVDQRVERRTHEQQEQRLTGRVWFVHVERCEYHLWHNHHQEGNHRTVGDALGQLTLYTLRLAIVVVVVVLADVVYLL